MEATCFILSLQPVLNNISTSLNTFKNLPGALAELGNLVNTFQELLASFEREQGGQGNFPWVKPLKDSLEEALQAIEIYKKQPIKCKIFSKVYLEKIENARRHIHDAVNATALSNAQLALQAKKTLQILSEKIEDLNHQNEEFQEDLKRALSENQTDTLQTIAKMNGMGNEYDLRQQLIDAEKEKKEVKSLMFDTEQKLAMQFSKLAITKMEEYPKEYKCPITLELMENPHILFQSGYTYEYEAIMMALAKKPSVDPYTNEPFDGPPFLKENYTLRSAIQGWKDNQRRKIHRMQSFRGSRNLISVASNQTSQIVPFINTQSMISSSNNIQPYQFPQSVPNQFPQSVPNQFPQSIPNQFPQSSSHSFPQSSSHQFPQSSSHSFPQSSSHSFPQPSSHSFPQPSSHSSPQPSSHSSPQSSSHSFPQSSICALLETDPQSDTLMKKTWRNCNKNNRSYIMIVGVIINVILISSFSVTSSKQPGLEQHVGLDQPIIPTTRPTQNFDSSSTPRGPTFELRIEQDPSSPHRNRKPISQHSMIPSSKPTVIQSSKPTVIQSLKPSAIPSTQPTIKSSTKPSVIPSTQPTIKPSSKSSAIPSTQPTIKPSSKASATPTTEPIMKLKKKLIQSGGGHDRFGSSVAVSGGIIVIGAYNGTYNGLAYIFTTSGDSLAILKAPDGAADDNFGSSVAVSGNIVVIGARGDKDKGPLTGSAYIFNTTGYYLAKLTAPDGAAGNKFGSSVAVSGDIVIVGNNHNGIDNGPYIFNTRGHYVAKLTSPDVATDNRFGSSVAVSGNIIVVGARNNDDQGYRSGAAYMFSTSGDYLAKFTAPDGAAGDRFGSSVAISGNIIVIGARNNDENGSDSGSAYIFDSIGHYIAKLTAPDGAAGEYFGSSVAISGDTVVVGAWGDQVHGQRSGSAHIFNKIGHYIAKITAPDGEPYDHFGWSVSVSDNIVVVGAWFDEVFGFNSGSAYIFSTSVV